MADKSDLRTPAEDQNTKEAQAVQTLFARSEDFPAEFRQYLSAYFEANPPRIPLSALEGGASLERRVPGTGKLVFYSVSDSGEEEAEPGWLVANGAAVSRTTYADLFDAIGTSYGVGDGSTTFNLPDTKDRFLVSQSSGDADFDPIGTTGGARTVTLSTSNLPSHTHGAGSFILGNSYKQTTDTIAAVGEGSRNYPTQSGAGDVSITGTSGSTGSGTSFSKLPPFLTVGGWLIAY